MIPAREKVKGVMSEAAGKDRRQREKGAQGRRRHDEMVSLPQLDMNLNKLWKTVQDRGVLVRYSPHGFAKNSATEQHFCETSGRAGSA